MAAALPFISIGLSVIGGLRQRSAATQYDVAADQTRALADDNAVRIEREAVEERRRLTLEQTRRESSARAYAAASGVTLQSGSVGNYLEEMTAEHRQQRDWLTKAAREEASITRKEGDLAGESLEYRGDQQRWRGTSTMFSSIGSAYGAASSMGWI